MSDWLNWDSALKVIPLATAIAGTVKSWRNRWKGPRSLARFWHREAQLVLMRQDRDYYRATCDELIERINQNAVLTDFLDSLNDSESPKVLPIQEVHKRDPSLTPITRPRLIKRKLGSTKAPKP